MCLVWLSTDAPLRLQTEGGQLQQRILFGDEADAHSFWKDKEWKTFAVDLVTGSGKKRKIIHTMYVRARTGDGAESCAKENDLRRVPRTSYCARLAGPRELGCN